MEARIIYSTTSDEDWEEYEIFRESLDGIDIGENIVCIADLGLWDGRHPAYKELPSKLYTILKVTQGDEFEVYIDGDVKMADHHHDGTNYYTFRKWKPNVSYRKRDWFANKVCEGKLTPKIIEKYTDSLVNDFDY